MFSNTSTTTSTSVPTTEHSSSTLDSSEITDVPFTRESNKRSRVKAAGPKSKQSEQTYSRIKSAKSAINQTVQVYIGGVSSSVTVDDISAELVGIGVSSNSTSIRVLQEKDNWKSFVVTVPKDMAKSIYDSPSWPHDINVRPFRANIAGRDKAHRGLTKTSLS